MKDSEHLRLQRDIDGELAPEERAAWNRTLAQRPDLEVERRRLAVLSAAVRAARPPSTAALPLGLADRIHAAVEREQTLPRVGEALPWLSLVRRSALLAAAALVIAGLLFVSRLPQEAHASPPSVTEGTRPFLPRDDLLRLWQRQPPSRTEKGSGYLDFFWSPVPRAGDS